MDVKDPQHATEASVTDYKSNIASYKAMYGAATKKVSQKQRNSKQKSLIEAEVIDIRIKDEKTEERQSLG